MKLGRSIEISFLIIAGGLKCFESESILNFYVVLCVRFLTESSESLMSRISKILLVKVQNVVHIFYMNLSLLAATLKQIGSR